MKAIALIALFLGTCSSSPAWAGDDVISIDKALNPCSIPDLEPSCRQVEI